MRLTVKPKDLFEHIWVHDIVDLTWEALRWRRLSANFLNAVMRDAADLADGYKCHEPKLNACCGIGGYISLLASWWRGLAEPSQLPPLKTTPPSNCPTNGNRLSRARARRIGAAGRAVGRRRPALGEFARDAADDAFRDGVGGREHGHVGLQ